MGTWCERAPAVPSVVAATGVTASCTSPTRSISPLRAGVAQLITLQDGGLKEAPSSTDWGRCSLGSEPDGAVTRFLLDHLQSAPDVPSTRQQRSRIPPPAGPQPLDHAQLPLLDGACLRVSALQSGEDLRGADSLRGCATYRGKRNDRCWWPPVCLSPAPRLLTFGVFPSRARTCGGRTCTGRICVMRTCRVCDCKRRF